MDLIKIYFKLVFQKKVVLRGFRVAIIVGVILNLINQGDVFWQLNFDQLNLSKFLLTFIVPYVVSSYSSAMAKMHFEVGEIAPMNAILKCKDCDDEILHINKGEVIPDCDHCINGTKWKILKRGIASPKKYSSTAESMALFAQMNPAPVFRFDVHGTILTSNSAADQFFGNQSIEGRDVHQLLKEFVSYDFQKVIDKGEIKSFVVRMADKSMRFEMRGIPNHGVCQVYGADITSALNVKLENLRLSAAVQQTSNSVMITNVQGDIVFVNKAFENTTGYLLDEVKGRNPRFLKTGNLDKEEYVTMWNTISAGNVWKGEFYNQKKNGEKYWEEATISPIRDEGGELINYMAVKEDITEQKQIKYEMRSMALFAELNPEPVFRVGKGGVVIKANPAANVSFNVDSIESKYFLEILPKCTDINIDKIIDAGSITTIEEVVGDRVFRFILRGLPEFNACQVYGSDVTLRKQAEEKVRRQNESISQSIKYASRIQNAVLPKSSSIKVLMPDHFIFFKPRDVVSGDFYWSTHKNKKLIIAVADCTGHGVPGAFMSMLGIASLNEIVNKNNEESAHHILNKLRDNIKSTLAQTNGRDAAKDGMDIALCVVDYEEMQISYAGAYNPLMLIRDGELIQYKADKMPIGMHLREKSSFTNHLIDIVKGDIIYMFSDGFVDQFGGEADQKFSSKRFKNLLMKIHKLSMEEQNKVLESELMTWKGEKKQLDDILIFGGKI